MLDELPRLIHDHLGSELAFPNEPPLQDVLLHKNCRCVKTPYLWILNVFPGTDDGQEIRVPDGITGDQIIDAADHGWIYLTMSYRSIRTFIRSSLSQESATFTEETLERVLYTRKQLERLNAGTPTRRGTIANDTRFVCSWSCRPSKDVVTLGNYLDWNDKHHGLSTPVYVGNESICYLFATLMPDGGEGGIPRYINKETFSDAGPIRDWKRSGKKYYTLDLRNIKHDRKTCEFCKEAEVPESIMSNYFENVIETIEKDVLEEIRL